MLQNAEELIGVKLTLLGLEDRLEDDNKGLNVDLMSIDKVEGVTYKAVFEHKSHNIRVTAKVTADNPDFKPGSDADIHNTVFEVNEIQVDDIRR